jgi:hypothetical protein
MKSLELNTLGVIELDCKQLQEITGGVSPWWSVVGPIIEATVRIMAAYADAYVNYSAETGGKYVIHHAY